jgi:hypothetical protein
VNINIRAKDSFVHNDISMAKREERKVPEAQAKALIEGGLAELVTPRASQQVQHAPRATGTRRAPAGANKMAAALGNKAGSGPSAPVTSDAGSGGDTGRMQSTEGHGAGEGAEQGGQDGGQGQGGDAGGSTDSSQDAS